MQIGDGGVQNNVFVTVGRAVRSAYQHQVRTVAPAELLNRQPELEELAAFCTSPENGGYLWWRAPAWAGKSALMAWFALNPPPGVHVVCFFITGRFASHSDRIGFLDVVLEQLAELLDRPLPAHLTDATSGAHLLAMVTDAAALCQERGEQLVLLVDGLDEDRGAVPGPEVHSIAALLPARLPHGLKVVIASRPDPPLPVDVPDDHPLRTGDVVIRILGMSPHAQVVRRDAERELKRLLHGSPVEQDLLGLVTASGGGLRAADLAELTGLDRWRVGEHLGAVTARTFTRRSAPTQGVPGAAAGTAPDTYLLAHEELQASASRFLAPRLSAYRERLCAWAELYRERDWPADTPDYLLRGYAAMLADTRMVTELVACATDRARHARMLSRTGGDAAALAEIGAAQDTVFGQETPDLRSLGVLAVHQGLLSGRNAALPTALPTVWAVLGDFARAEALAGAAPEAQTRAALLTDLVERAGHAGEETRTVHLAKRVTATVRNITNSWLRNEALVRLATVLTEVGLMERATAVIGSLPDGQRRTAALKSVKVLAGTGRDEPLHALIDQVVRPEEQEDAWQAVAEVWAGHGRVMEAEQLAATLTSRAQAFALESVVQAHAAAGEHGKAEATAAAIPDRFRKERALKRVAVELARVGRYERAEAIVDGISEPMLRGAGLEQLAETAAAVVARGDAGAEDRTLAARLWACACAFADAEPDPEFRVDAWTRLVRIAALAAGPAQMHRLADRTEMVARTLKRPYRASHALSNLAVALAHAGAYDRAEELLRTLSSYTAQETARRVIEVAVRRGHHERAEALVRSGESAVVQDVLLLAMVHALRKEGHLPQATAAARTLRSPRRRAEGLGELALAVAETGEHHRAAELAVEAEREARSFIDPVEEGRSLTALLRALTVAGDRTRIGLLAQRAGAVGCRIAEENPHSDALPELVEALYRAAELGPAAKALHAAQPAARAAVFTTLVRTAGRVRRPGHVTAFADKALAAARSEQTDPESAPYLVSRLAQALHEAGSPNHAEDLLTTVEHPVAQADGWTALVKATSHDDRTRLERLADRAEAAVADMQPSNARDEALLRLAEALVEAGAHHRAETVARPLLHPYAKDVATTVRIHTAAGRRDWEEIDRLARTMQSPSRLRHTMSLLATAAAGNGDTAGARNLLRVVPAKAVGPEEWDGLVGRVAVAIAASGDPAAAQTLAESVPFPADRSLVLTSVARKLEPSRALPLLARALREGDWRRTVGALGRRWPHTIEAMADAYLDGAF